MTTSAIETFELSQKLFSNLFQKIKTSIIGSDFSHKNEVIIIGVSEGHTSLILQLFLAKIALALDYELLLPYDFEKLLKMETDVKRGVINSPQHQLVKILLV